MAKKEIQLVVERVITDEQRKALSDKCQTIRNLVDAIDSDFLDGKNCTRPTGEIISYEEASSLSGEFALYSLLWHDIRSNLDNYIERLENRCKGASKLKGNDEDETSLNEIWDSIKKPMDALIEGGGPSDMLEAGKGIVSDALGDIGDAISENTDAIITAGLIARKAASAWLTANPFLAGARGIVAGGLIANEVTGKEITESSDMLDTIFTAAAVIGTAATLFSIGGLIAKGVSGVGVLGGVLGGTTAKQAAKTTTAKLAKTVATDVAGKETMKQAIKIVSSKQVTFDADVVIMSPEVADRMSILSDLSSEAMKKALGDNGVHPSEVSLFLNKLK